MVTINDTPLRHAPGPWEAEDQPFNGFHDITDANGKLIAKVYSAATDGGTTTGHAVAQHIANYSPAPGRAVVALNDMEAEWVITALLAEVVRLPGEQHVATRTVLEGIVQRVKQAQGREPLTLADVKGWDRDYNPAKHDPNYAARDKAAWDRGDTCSYAGFKIVPKRDFGTSGYFIKGQYVKHGWVVTDGVCNVLPGATWGRTMADAKHLIDVYLAVDGHADKFWHLLYAVRGPQYEG